MGNAPSPRRSKTFPHLAASVFFAVLIFAWKGCVLLFTGGKFGKWMPQEFLPYYRGEHWRKIRWKALAHYHYKCAVCGNDHQHRGKRLYVRHLRQFDHEGKSVFEREDIEHDLIVLCEDHLAHAYTPKKSIKFWKKAYKMYRPLLD